MNGEVLGTYIQDNGLEPTVENLLAAAITLRSALKWEVPPDEPKVTPPSVKAQARKELLASMGNVPTDMDTED